MKKILKAKIPPQEKADLIFGSKESKIKDVFIKTCFSDGGLEDACKILGVDLEKHKRKFNSSSDYRKASLIQMNFEQKIIRFLCKRFKA